MLRNASAAFGLRVSGAALLFIFNWLIVRYLGVKDSGVFFLAFTLLTIFSTAFLFGVDQYSLRNISAENDERRSKYFFLKGSQFVVLSSIIGGIVVAGLSKPLGHIFKSPELSNTLLILSLTMPPLTITAFLGGAVQAKRKTTRSAFILTNSYYLTSIAVFVILHHFSYTDLPRLNWAYVAAMGISLVVNAWLSFPLYSKSGSVSTPIQAREPTITGLAKNSFYLFIVSLLYMALGWMDILLVGYFLSPRQVSIYSIASKIAKLLTFSLFAINIILAPVVSKYHAEKNLDKLNREAQKATVLSALFCLPLLLIMLFYPSWLLNIFGHAYESGANTLRILALGQAINAFTGAVLIIMVMVKLEKKLNLLSAIVLVIQFVLGIVLTPIFGMQGTAIAMMIGMSLINLWGAFYLYHYHSIRMFPSLQLMKELAGAKAKSSVS